MYEVKAPQGSPEWHQARCGKITASRFKDVMTNARGGEGWSKTALSYADEIIGEILTLDYKNIEAASLDWGTENEPLAIEAYELFADTFVVPSGLVLLNEKSIIGGSPDGLVDSDGIIEVKCPYNPANHVKTLRCGMPREHIPQIQGNMYVTEREWCDFISFDPRIDGKGRLYVERVERDEMYIKKLSDRLSAFRELIEKTLISITG